MGSRLFTGDVEAMDWLIAAHGRRGQAVTATPTVDVPILLVESVPLPVAQLEPLTMDR